MELIPKVLVVGVTQGPFPTTGPLVPLQAPQQLTRDVINRIWSAVVKDYPYQSLQLEPTGKGAVFLGESNFDLVVLQPPLFQFRSTFDDDSLSTTRRLAEKAQTIFGIILQHVPNPPPLNLGVRMVYHSPAPGGDAVAFARTDLVNGEEDLRTLAGGMAFEAAIKVLMHGEDRDYTLAVEPLLADRSVLFIDLDGQFPGIVDQAHISDRILEVESFLVQQVRHFIESRAQEWS